MNPTASRVICVPPGADMRLFTVRREGEWVEGRFVVTHTEYFYDGKPAPAEWFYHNTPFTPTPKGNTMLRNPNTPNATPAQPGHCNLARIDSLIKYWEKNRANALATAERSKERVSTYNAKIAELRAERSRALRADETMMVGPGVARARINVTTVGNYARVQLTKVCGMGAGTKVHSFLSVDELRQLAATLTRAAEVIETRKAQVRLDRIAELDRHRPKSGPSDGEHPDSHGCDADDDEDCDWLDRF